MYQHAYVQLRKQGLTRATFRERWRAHYDVATTCREYWRPVCRYVQNDVADDVDLPGLDRSFDAIGEFFYADRADRQAVADAPRDAIAEDAATLYDVQPTTLFFGGDHRHVAGCGEASWKLFRLLARREDVPHEAFAHAVDEATAHVETLGCGAAVASGHDGHFAFAAAVTIWFEDVETVRATLSGGPWRAFARAVSAVADGRSLTVLTRERVLQRTAL